MKKYLLPRWLIQSGFELSRLLSAERYPLAAPNSDALFCARPLFIISSGRAGTTLLRSMLVAGGRMAIPQEFPVIHNAVWYVLKHQNTDWPIICRDVAALIEATPNFKMWNMSLDDAVARASQLPESERSLARLIDVFLAAYAETHIPEATHWGDQSPLHTFYTDWIYPVFPQARFVHLLRDGRDVVSSFLKRGDLSLDEAVQRWTTSVDRAHQLRDKLPASQFLEVCYEDIVQSPEAVLERVADFAGIPYTERMLEYWKLPSTVEHKHLSYHENIGRPVFTSSVGKWKQRLNDSQKERVLRQSARHLERLGYLDSPFS